MKRLAALALVSVLFLTGCGKSEEDYMMKARCYTNAYEQVAEGTHPAVRTWEELDKACSSLK